MQYEKFNIGLIGKQRNMVC